MGWGCFSKTSGIDNKKHPSIVQRDSLFVTKNENSTPFEPVREISTNSDKGAKNEPAVVKKEKSKKKKAKKKPK